MVTSRLGLIQPLVTDTMPSGADNLSTNYNKIDTAVGAEIGATAPTNLFTGCFWFDTTVNELKIYNGSAWQSVQGDNWVREVDNYNLDGTPRSTNTDILVLSETQTLTASLKYLVRWSIFLKWANSQVGGVFQLNFKIGATVIHSRQFQDDGGSIVNLGIDTVGFFEYIPAATGSVTIEMHLTVKTAPQNYAALCNVGNAVAQFSIEHWGN